MDAEEDFPGLMSFGLTDDDPESSDEADWRTDDDSDPHFDSQTGTDDDSDPHSDSSAGAFSYGEWKDGDESAEAPEVDRSTMSRRDRIRFGHDPEKTSCWTARNKNRMADSLKRKFACSQASIADAVQFHCPCVCSAGVCVLWGISVVSPYSHILEGRFGRNLRLRIRRRLRGTIVNSIDR